jgi:hypothetical protein
MGESTLIPPKIVSTNIIFLQIIVLVMYKHHILNYFCLFSIYVISFKPNLINYLKNPIDIEKIEQMEYICDKRIPITKFEILNIYFKTRVVDGILG